jgi:predicted DNA-binding transcriptional regulator AlpA
VTDHIELSVEDKIDDILKEMASNKEKINVSQVASRLGLSHSAIYKQYPTKLPDIQTAQKRQKLKAESMTLGSEVEKLKKIITDLKGAKAESQNLAMSYQEQNKALWEHIQQVYNMYDEVLAERNGFAERLKHLK